MDSTSACGFTCQICGEFHSGPEMHWHTPENCLRRQLAAANERAAALEKALNKLITVTNGVTAPHRHNAPISMKHLDRLCEVQLECERIIGGA